MPTIKDGQIQPETGKITYPDSATNDAASTNSASSSSNSSDTNSSTSSRAATDSNTIMSVTGFNISNEGGEGILAYVNGGETTTFAFKSLAAGTGIALTADGSSITISSTVTGSAGDILPVIYGGTGVTSMPANALLLGNNTSQINFVNAPSTNGQFLTFDGSNIKWGSITASNVSGLATVATSGSYNDLANQPLLSTVAHTGSYTDLTNTPVLSVVATSGSYNDLLNKPNLAKVATSGVYTDLTGTPVLATVATTGKYSDLTGTPVLATVATTGSYTDLINTPTPPTPYTLPIASATVLGGVKVSSDFSISSDGTISIPAGLGSVKSVALNMPSIFAVSGSPVTTTGTLTAVLLGQNANTFFSGPATGSADIPTFRKIEGVDLPPATTSSLGAIIVGPGLNVDISGNLSTDVYSFMGRTGAIVLQSGDMVDKNGNFILASPSFVGMPTAPTPATTDNSTTLATTAFVKNALTAFNIPPATISTIGGVIVGSGLTVDSSGNLSANVTKFMGRTGAITLQPADLQNQNTGNFLLDSPIFTGAPQAPTTTITDNSNNIATTSFVHSLVNASGVSSFNGRTGVVTFTSADLTNAGGAPINSPVFVGNPTAPTLAISDSTTSLATTAFVHNLVNASGVSTFNGRSGTVTLQASDLQTSGGAFLLDSPVITGTPTASTAATGTNSSQLATTAFVQNTLNSVAVTSVAGKTGAVTLSYTDIAGAAPIDSPVFTGLPSIDGHTPFLIDDIGNTLATTSWVYQALAGASVVNIVTYPAIPAKYYNMPIMTLVGTVNTGPYTVTLPSTGKWTIINNAGPAIITLSCGTGQTLDLVGGGIYEIIADGGIYFANEMGVTRPFNDSTKYLATTEFVATAIGSLATGVTSFNTRTGAIIFQASDMQATDGTFLLSSPQFTGTPTAPTPPAGTNTSQIATTAFVANSFAPLASPALTGTPTAPTAAQGDNSSTIATTSFVNRFMSGTVSISASANMTLTAGQYSSEIIEFIGVMTQSIVVTVPTSGQWMMYNNTSGAFEITISNGSGSTYVVPQNQSATIMSLGALGIVNANIAGSVFTPATATTLGGVIVPNGGGITVNSNGDISIAPGTASALGGVKQGSGVTIAGDGTLSANVTSVAGRTGAVVLTVSDVSGAAPLASPTFTGVPVAPTASSGTNNTQIATTGYVQNATQGFQSVTVASGTVVLTSAQYSVPVIVLTGTLTANTTVQFPTSGAWLVYVTATLGSFTLTLTNTVGATLNVASNTVYDVLSNSSAGMILVSSTNSVTSFNGRTGIVTLTTADITGAGGAPIASPTFTGAVTLPAPPSYTANDLHAATTNFAYQAGQGVERIDITGLVSTQSFALTPEQYRYPIIEIFGNPNSTGVTLTFPSNGHWWVYCNTNNGIGWTANVQCATGPSYTLAVGQWYEFVADSGAGTGLLLLSQSSGNGPNGVQSFNGRTGVVTLSGTDITNAGGALLASPAFTGTPTAPTATTGTNTTQLATTAFVTTATTGLAPLASPAFTGTPTAPTATAGTNTTQLATTAFVTSSYAPLASPTFTGRAQIPASTFTVTNLGNVSGTVTMDLTTASEWAMTITGATTIAFSNPPNAGMSEVIYLRITNGGSSTITWPASTKFAAATAPTLTASGMDMLGVAYDSVTSTYMVFVIGLNIG